jgi:lysylphosphatidylglycerol synthetase-like protein (DUF2156 family)
LKIALGSGWVAFTLGNNMTQQETNTEIVQTISLTDYVGAFPIMIAILALIIGVSALIVRRRCWIQAAIIFELALCLWGASITCWRLYRFNSIYYDYDGPVSPDPSMWLHQFSLSWTSAAASLFGVSIGLMFIGVAWLFKKQA